MKSRVAVLRTRPETVLEDIARLCDLAGVRAALRAGTRTILKDNISWHFPFPGANTTPWQLEGTILALRQAGFADLVCVQNNTVVTDPKKGERLNGYLGVLAAHNVPVRYNCDPHDLRWVLYEPRGEMLALPKIFPHGIRIPEFFAGTNIVHLPTVKCHIYTTTTGAMKNAFGGLLATRRHYTHTWIHETLVDLLAIQKEIHAGLFAVMDGTTAGDGPGPRTMRPVRKDVMLASSDQVAIDAVAAKLMSFDPLSIRYLALAHERQRHMRQRSKVATRSDGATRGHHRMHSVVEKVTEQFGHHRAHTRKAEGQGIGTKQEQPARLASVQRLSHPAGVAAHHM
jgi:uncharacterized protein (DUF362 family)